MLDLLSLSDFSLLESLFVFWDLFFSMFLYLSNCSFNNTFFHFYSLKVGIPKVLLLTQFTLRFI